LRDVGADVVMPEAGGTQGKQTERLHQRQNPAIPEPEPGGALVVHEDRLTHGIKGVFADQAIVAQRFDAQQAPVGGKADLPQGGQIAERPTNGKS
jgi:hypothetical protein